MEEIKFRAFDKREGLGRMLYLKGFVKYGKGWNGGDPKLKFYELYDDGGGFMSVSAAECEIMQFTGMTDMDKREVYVGDILEFLLGDEKTERGVVRWSEKGYWTSQEVTKHEELLGDELAELKARVVGNIWENPEMRVV